MKKSEMVKAFIAKIQKIDTIMSWILGAARIIIPAVAIIREWMA